MKKLVISLLRRPDRKAEFQKNRLSDFHFIEAVDGSQEVFRHIKARKGWVDPFRNRSLLQNEVACFLSHIKAWQKCIDLNEPCIIFEDDAIINEHYNESSVEAAIKEYDFIYLQRNENEPESTLELSSTIEIPSYPYNMTAYAIKPESAQKLLKRVDYQDFIPVDEFLPEKLRDVSFNIVAFKQDMCNQLPREMGDIENGQPFRNFKVHVTTCGTDRKRMVELNTSARHHGIDIVNLGLNVDWKGTDMKGLGGGMKINLMKDYLEKIHDDDIVLFTDGYDVFYADNLDTITERFLDFGHDVLFSGEMICWPHADVADQFPDAPTRFKYINSGTYIGRAKELKKIMNHAPIEHHEDDQAYIHSLYFECIYDIAIDYECYIFQTNFEEVKKLGSQLHNPETECCPCIYHGNGGERALEFFQKLYKEFYPPTPSFFIPHHKVDFLSKDMMLVDFMTQDQCERLIDLADQNGQWGSLSYDKFPAQEIRMRELGLWEELDKAWQDNIVPTVEKYFKPIQMYGLRDGFVMRYAMDTQTNLNLHHDASLVTGSVKLNEDYEGAELIFPRQGIVNTDVPVGKMILFPAAVTHGHECLPLKSGVKYSLTIWSRRWINDNI